MLFSRIVRFLEDKFKFKLLSTELVKQFEGTCANALKLGANGDRVYSNGCTGIIFSKNRPLQLDFLLRSYEKFAKNPCDLHVICYAVEEYRGEYGKLFDEYEARNPGYKLILHYEDDGFKRTLIDVVEKIETDRLYFLVDDIVFYQPLDIGELATIDTDSYVYSMRLGSNITHCYTLDCDAAPNDATERDGLIYWDWRGSSGDWMYPLSVDGNLFSTADVTYFVQVLDYNSPNNFESGLQLFKEVYLQKKGLCQKVSPLVNIPWTLVQNDYNNRFGGLDEKDLLDLWRDDVRLEVSALDKIETDSPHKIFPLKLFY